VSDSSFPSHPRSINPHPICLSPIGSHSKSRQPSAPTDAPAATPHHCSRRSLHAATRWPTAPPPAPATGARVPLAREPSVRQVPDRQIAEARFCSGRSRPALASACSRLLWPRLRSAPPTPGCSPPLPSGPHVWLPTGGCLLPPCRLAAMAMVTAAAEFRSSHPSASMPEPLAASLPVSDPAPRPRRRSHGRFPLRRPCEAGRSGSPCGWCQAAPPPLARSGLAIELRPALLASGGGRGNHVGGPVWRRGASGYSWSCSPSPLARPEARFLLARPKPGPARWPTGPG